MTNFFGNSFTNFLDVSAEIDKLNDLLVGPVSSQIIEKVKKWKHTLINTNGEIVFASSQIVPANFLSHQRFKKFDTNSSDLT